MIIGDGLIGSELEADLVVSAVGLVPNIWLANEACIDCGRGIRVNEYLATSLAGIHALGGVLVAPENVESLWQVTKTADGIEAGC